MDDVGGTATRERSRKIPAFAKLPTGFENLNSVTNDISKQRDSLSTLLLQHVQTEESVAEIENGYQNLEELYQISQETLEVFSEAESEVKAYLTEQYRPQPGEAEIETLLTWEDIMTVWATIADWQGDVPETDGSRSRSPETSLRSAASRSIRNSPVQR